MATRGLLSLSDEQMRMVSVAAAGIPPWRRAIFLRAIAGCLEGAEVGDLAVRRAVTIALNRYGDGSSDPVAA
jgi:hypothetical protein